VSTVGSVIVILAMAVCAAVIWVLLIARDGFIIETKRVDRSAPESTQVEELLHQIDRVYDELPVEFWQRFQELAAKRDAESLVRDGPEHQELIRMTDEMEDWNARRVGLLLDLARLRKVPIDEVLREFRHRAVAHG
jgi:hypothetical protein